MPRLGREPGMWALQAPLGASRPDLPVDAAVPATVLPLHSPETAPPLPPLTRYLPVLLRRDTGLPAQQRQHLTAALIPVFSLCISL